MGRYGGLACDSLTRVQLVLANGTSVEAASEGPHSDLFWASCGGGGGTFGVATEFTLKLTELPNNSSAVAVIEVNTQWSGLPRLGGLAEVLPATRRIAWLCAGSCNSNGCS